MGGGGEDDDATTTTRRPALVVGPGAERTEGDAHLQGSLFGAESGEPLGAVRAKGLVSGLAGRRGGDAAGRGAVGRHRRPGRCGSAFGGAPVLRMLESQLLPVWPAVSSTSSLRTSEATKKIFPFLEWLRVGEAEQVELRECRGRRSSRGVGPDTCLVISHAHRIAINEQEKGSGAGRRCAGAGTKVAKGSFVEVWEVGSGFCWTTARASRERSCSATRNFATRSPTPACWGSRCAGGSGSATPTTRIFR